MTDSLPGPAVPVLDLLLESPLAPLVDFEVPLVEGVELVEGLPLPLLPLPLPRLVGVEPGVASCDFFPPLLPFPPLDPLPPRDPGPELGVKDWIVSMVWWEASKSHAPNFRQSGQNLARNSKLFKANEKRHGWIKSTMESSMERKRRYMLKKEKGKQKSEVRMKQKATQTPLFPQLSLLTRETSISKQFFTFL